MSKNSIQIYQLLMEEIQERTNIISGLLGKEKNKYDYEIIALNLRKIIELIAYGCIVASKNGGIVLDRQTEGNYSAEKILKTFQKKLIETFPSPSILREATSDEVSKHKVHKTIEGVPSKRITKNELVQIYTKIHKRLHGINPHGKVNIHQDKLIDDFKKVSSFIERHYIGINGIGFYCILEDKVDFKTKVIQLSKLENLP